jgi:2-polyprenyl-6-methoxyphenol hydroxylase-like FAD-dependent oxidoreductase
MSKIAIIGGGIAGLATANLLQQQGHEVTVSEREHGLPTKGNAFLMHPAGLEVLHELTHDTQADFLPGEYVRHFNLYSQTKTKLEDKPLSPWKCIKRNDLIQFLYNLLPADCIYSGRLFSHFEFENGNAKKAVFVNGETEEADFFIGADGSNSVVRKELFGFTEYTDTTVKEIVCVTHFPEFAKKYKGVFTKFQDTTQGRAVGFIPSTDDEIVWFFQYDVSLADLEDEKPETMRKFCETNLADFPHEVQLLISENDFNTSYLWRTRDFDPLPRFHKRNIILIGDAAHLALPFTSAGTTNALVDAKVLTDCFAHAPDFQTAFDRFYELRHNEVTEQIYLGRKLKLQFLTPLNFQKLDVPLI